MANGATDRRIGLFRAEAIAGSTGRLGGPVQIAGLASWILVTFLIALLAGVTTFLCAGHYARKETVQGTLEPSLGAAKLLPLRPGSIVSLHVVEGQTVAQGKAVATLSTDSFLEGGRSLGKALLGYSEDQQLALSEDTDGRIGAIKQQLAQGDIKARALTARLSRLESDRSLQTERLSLSRASLQAADTLHAQGLFSDLQYRQRQENVLVAQQQLSALEQQIDDARAEIAQTHADERRLSAEAKSVEAQARLNNAQLAERRASIASERLFDVVAPRAGRVVAVHVKPGALVSASTPIATILPPGATLDAQLWAPSRAIGFVRKGTKVRLMYDAFPYQRFGVGKGTVVAVGDVPTAPNELPADLQSNEALYRVTVKLDHQTVDAYGKSWPLVPGARLKADLVLESRSLMEWLLEPLYAIRKRSE